MTRVLLEGRNVVIESLIRGRKIFEIKIDKNSSGEKMDTLIKLARDNSIRILKVNRKVLDKISKTDSHQGVIAQAESLKTTKLSSLISENEEPFVVILREVFHKRNFGAVLRTAAAAGADAVIVPPTRKGPFDPLVERTSMGASNEITVIEAGTYDAISSLKKAGVKIVGVELTGDQDYFKSDLRGPVAFVIGGEDTGLSLPLREKCDIVVRVPMRNNVQSLNLSVAAGILLYEKVRQDL